MSLTNRTSWNECQIRNYYAENIQKYREKELVVATEQQILGTNLRTDMKTIDQNNIVRIWEFKIFADHHVLGQILPYIALTRRIEKLPIRGVVAAFKFSDELIYINEALNLNLEFIKLQKTLTNQSYSEIPSIPAIPLKVQIKGNI